MDYDYVHGRHEERIERSLRAYGAGSPAPRDCPLERLARWIVARRRAKLDPAPLAR